MIHGFEFSGSGTLQRVDTFTSKAGKTILTLVIEVSGQYPQLVPIKVFGRMAERADEWQPGDKLSVTGRLGGRDWNGKVYGDIIANDVTVIAQRADVEDAPRSGPMEERGPGPDDDLPF
jgi:single-stranded DNA-binding protein